jgi:hypothetical protein
MGLFLQHMKSRISRNNYETILHNIMQGRHFPTMRATKKVDPHRIERLATNVV